jgi:hypothetical protein
MKRSIFGAGVLAALCALNLASPFGAQAGYVKVCNSYDWDHWNNAYPWGNTHNGSAYMNSSQVSLNGSSMALHATRSSANSGYSYLSGTIYGKTQIVVDSQHVNWTVTGTFEADPESGSWPAMWLCYAYGWPPESDIMEFKGSDYVWQNTFLCNQQCTSHETYVSNPYSSWHTYKIWMNYVDSTNVTIDYYVDGTWEARDTADFTGKAMNLIIDLQTDGSSGTAYFNDTYLNSSAIEVGYSTPANNSISSGYTYKLKNANSGKVLGISGASTSDGADAVQWDDNGTSDHNWVITQQSDGNYKLQNVNSGKVLGVSGMSTIDGADAVQWDDNGTMDHEWAIYQMSDGNYKLINANSGKVLGINGSSTSDGADAVQWDDNGTSDHEWTLTTTGPSTGTYYYMQNRTSGLVIDSRGATSVGSQVAQWSKVSSSNLKWQLVASDSGYYYIQNQTTGLYLDGGGYTSNGSAVKEWSYASSSNLQWQLVASDSGYYYIQNRATGMYLDGGGATASGAALKQWSYASSSNLQWLFQ